MGRFCQAILRNLEYREINNKPLNGFKEDNVESDLYYDCSHHSVQRGLEGTRQKPRDWLVVFYNNLLQKSSHFGLR